MKKLIVLALGSLALLAPTAQPCTAFLIAQGGRVFAGNNEDYWDPDTKVWFVTAEKGTYGRVCFGFGNMFAQGGMNTEGLFFDGFATGRYPVKGFEGKKAFEGNLIDHALATCANVREVIALFEQYDLRFLETAMLMFGDKSGDSVIIEGDVFVRKEGRYQITTNFYQSPTKPENYTCPRWNIADRMLGESEEASVDLCRRVLAAVHAEEVSQTLYSNVYDLQKGLVYLYHFHNFAEVVVLDLAEELKKGARTIDLPSLFPESFAHQRWVAKKKAELEEEKARRRAKKIDSFVLDELVGGYELTLPDGRTLVLRVRREGDRLLVAGEDGDEAEIIPESDFKWFYIGPEGNADYAFHLGEEGSVTGLTVDFMGTTLEGKRVD